MACAKLMREKRHKCIMGDDLMVNNKASRLCIRCMREIKEWSEKDRKNKNRTKECCNVQESVTLLVLRHLQSIRRALDYYSNPEV